MSVNYKKDSRDDIFDAYAADPVGMFTDQFGREYWSKQKEALDVILNRPDIKKVSIASATGTGKTTLATDAAYMWLCKYPGGMVRVVAPGEKSLKTIFFKKFKSVLSEDRGGSDFLASHGKLTELEFELGEDWNVLGVNAQNTGAMSGHHNDDMLVIIDEGAGVDDYMIEAAEGWCTQPNNKMLLMFNPYDTTGVAYDSFHSDAESWYRISISSFDSPNCTEEAMQAYPELIELMKERAIPFSTEEVSPYLASVLPSPENIYEKWKTAKRTGRWGKFQWQVLGEFPDQDAKSLMNALRLNIAMKRQEFDYSNEYVLWSELKFSVDVAREGVDNSVIAMAEGPRSRILEKIPRNRLDELAFITVNLAVKHYEKIRAMRKEHGNNDFGQSDVKIVVDIGGMGVAVYENIETELWKRGLRFQVIGFKPGGGPLLPENKEVYLNRRTEAWFHFADNVLAREELDMPDDAQLQTQLLGCRYEYNGKDSYKLEPKRVMAKRTGGSPDEADAIIMLYAPEDGMAGYVESGYQG